MDFQEMNRDVNPNINRSVNSNVGARRQPSSSRFFLWMFWMIIIITLFVFGFIFRDKLSSITDPKFSDYQAVFLTNGQVYFGKLSGINGTYITLKDIFYLQSNQQLQPVPSGQQSQLALIKLGNEIHGPEDAMHISRSQVLFFENLKSDGRVAMAIAEYKKNGGTAAPTAPTTLPGTQPANP